MNKHRIKKLKYYKEALIELKRLQLSLELTRVNNERFSPPVDTKGHVKVLTLFK